MILRSPALLALLIASVCQAVVRAEPPKESVSASEPPLPGATDSPDFPRQVQPLLQEKCFHCHGSDPATRAAQLRLDRSDEARAGGESGLPAIVPGDPDASELVRRIESSDDFERMPPADSKLSLSGEERELLRRWIASGARYEQHWAFEPLELSTAQAIDSSQKSSQHIDHLIDRVIAAVDIEPTGAASAEVICRRIHLDLVGLPPTLEDLDKFVTAAASDRHSAVHELIERLLASPHFGEKWARHWLDAARYSDSNGFEKDLPRQMWAWRDWVIGSLNSDQPYDDFLTEQLAGDLLSGSTQQQLIATGFLRNSMINEEGAIIPEEFRLEEQFNRMDCLGKAVLGISLQCAQCHTHKFDPLTHAEYYSLMALLNDTAEARSPIYDNEGLAAIETIKSQTRALREKYQASHSDWHQSLVAWKANIAANARPWQILRAGEMDHDTGLNHPTQAIDKTIYTLGHPTTKGYARYQFPLPESSVTAVRLECLCSDDLPSGGPGRSDDGTFAVTELKLEYRGDGQSDWQAVPIAAAQADRDTPVRAGPGAGGNAAGRVVEEGPAHFAIDGRDDTAWMPDDGPGRRNRPSSLVLTPSQPLASDGGILRISIASDYGPNDNGQGKGCYQIGRMRVAVLDATSSPAATDSDPIDHAAYLAITEPTLRQIDDAAAVVFDAWAGKQVDGSEYKNQLNAAFDHWPVPKTSVLHLSQRSRDAPRPTHILERGVWNAPGKPVAPGTPEFLPPIEFRGEQPNRLDFARWLCDSRHPLTARVAVNQMWQAVFGRGLVEMPEDFGSRTPPPVHRDVLDYLAARFIVLGWSRKAILHEILSTRAYGRSAAATPQQYARDPGNEFVARGPRFRLDAEVLRDVALSHGGLIHLKAIGGDSIFPPVPQSVLDYNYVKPTYWNVPLDETRYRRSLYIFRKRSMPDPVLESLDAPSGEVSCVRRNRSNTPLAALAVLNESIFFEAAQGFGKRLASWSADGPATALERGYRLCTGVAPDEVTAARLKAYYESQLARLQAGELTAADIAFSTLDEISDLPPDSTPNQLAAWTLVARVLLSMDETLCKP